MRTILFALVSSVLVSSALAACGAQPNQPVLANVPKPNTAAVAGGAAAAAAAITLASPDSHNPEKREDKEKKPIKVKEHVPAATLDRLDKAQSTSQPGDPPSSAPASNARPKAAPAGSSTESKAPASALDFGNE